MSKDKPDLLPCPFCGSAPVFKEADGEIGGDDSRRYYIIMCKEESCVVNPWIAVEGESGCRYHDKRTNSEALDLTVAKWNARVKNLD